MSKSNLRTLIFQFLLGIQVLMLMLPQNEVKCYQFKVGDLDSWTIPSPTNHNVYSIWSKFHSFKIGDSLLFLYPPSQDSVIQVTEQSYNNCNITDSILYMNNGNSLFNITTSGDFYFTSGVSGHCDKKQKLHISILSGNASSAFSPSYGPSASEISPSYPTVFGSIPSPPSSSNSVPVRRFSILMAAFIGIVVFARIGGFM